MKLPLSRPRRSYTGSTLVEAAIATAILAAFFGGLYAANGHAMMKLKQSVECTAATGTLQNRVEKVRTSTWAQITSPDFLRDAVLATPSGGASYLRNLSETITLNSYPEPLTYGSGTNTPETVQVVRGVNGITAVTALVGSVTLQRSFKSTTDYATARANQQLAIDYIARDLRGAYTVDLSADSQTLTLTTPDYYSAYHTQGNPTGTLVDPVITAGKPNYGNPTKPVTISYFINGGRLIRQQWWWASGVQKIFPEHLLARPQPSAALLAFITTRRLVDKVDLNRRHTRS